MGTPTAVTYANLFLYGIEKPLILKHKPSYYKRYIDDIYSIFNNTITANNYIIDFNAIVPSINTSPPMMHPATEKIYCFQ